MSHTHLHYFSFFTPPCKQEELEKKRLEAEEEARLPPDVLEKKRQEEAEALAHDSSKTSHYSRLGSTFAMKGGSALMGGRGGGRGGRGRGL